MEGNPKAKILVVDDMLTNIGILDKILNTEYEILTATSGKEALKIDSGDGGTPGDWKKRSKASL